MMYLVCRKLLGGIRAVNGIPNEIQKGHLTNTSQKPFRISTFHHNVHGHHALRSVKSEVIPLHATNTKSYI